MPKQNVPALRLEGFSGEWELKAIGELFAERNESFPEGELLSVTLRNGIKRFQEIGRRNTSNEDKSKYKLVEVGDIAYNSMRMWQGASGVSPWRGIVSPAYTVLKPVGNQDTSFFAYYFKTPFMVQVFQLNSQGLTSDTWNLKYPALSAIDIYRPQDIEEQQAIGAIFTNLDAAINQHTLKHKALQQAKTALMQRMFPQEGQAVPALRLEGFNGEWEVVKFGDFFRSTQLGINDLGEAGQFGTPLLKMGNIQRGYFDLDVYERLPESVSVSPEYLIYSDDFLINTRNTLELVGKGATWTGRSGVFTFNGNIARLELVGVDRRFFNYLYNLPSTIADVHKRATGTTSVAAIYPKTLESIEFLLPTLEEQQAIGAVFTQLDTLIAAEAQYIVSLKQAKTALLQRMFI